MRSLLRSLFPFLALSAVALAHGQTAISSTFNLSAFADADTSDGIDATDSFSDSQGATLNPYSHTVTATDTLASGSGIVTATSTASASWTDAGHGQVHISDTGWDLNSNPEMFVALDTANAPNLPVWSYTFAATSNGTFSMDYNVFATGQKFGLGGITIRWSGPGGDLSLFNPIDPTASGTFTRALTSGTNYTVSIEVQSNVLVAQEFNDSARLGADLDWKVQSVPEPASLSILTLALFPCLRRRRSRF
jgi:hypothetical protein